MISAQRPDARGSHLAVSNEHFLGAIFGAELPNVHVTCFREDPLNIPSESRARAWGGGLYSELCLEIDTNQYFTISVFARDGEGRARRKKSLLRSTYCFVLDDVGEKLPLEQVAKLPCPSWILVTSEGSEQWGYILDRPCSEAAMIDNLNDGLIGSDLVPSGKDPGQRGVTRYVRLPEGVNTKRSKMVNGAPFRCYLKSWKPLARTSLEQLAGPFDIDLTAPRVRSHPGSLIEDKDHPLFALTALSLKKAREKGVFDVTCPWVVEHTGQADDGAAVFLLEGGALGFKCHHGSCESRNGSSLMQWIYDIDPSFRQKLKEWQVLRAFGEYQTQQPAVTKRGLVSAFDQFKVSEEVINSMSNPDWLYENLLIRGHLIAIPAPPNAGKTTIMLHIAAQLAGKGLQVFYLNADVSGGDAKPMWHRAEEAGFALLLPDIANGTMGDFMSVLKQFAQGNEDLSSLVIIVDTLKKMTDVINKRESKAVYGTLRALTAKGGTVVLLSHTNKHKGLDGEYIFEGTGDLRADVDEMIYLEPVKNPDGSLLVSTRPDKVRGKFESITFSISADRSVSQEGHYVDTQRIQQEAERLEKDEELIVTIKRLLRDEPKNQSQIVEHCQKTTSYGKPTIRAVLKRYSEKGFAQTPKWVTRQGEQNAIVYALPPEETLCFI